MTDREFKNLCLAHNKLLEVAELLNGVGTTVHGETPLEKKALKWKHFLFNVWEKEYKRRKKAK
jgi:predicted protein tyrosine phosphatase